MKYCLGISNFLEEISSLSHSIVFLYFFSLITEEGFLAILWNSAFKWYIFPFLLYFSLPFLPQLFVSPPQTAIFLFLHFFFLGMVLLPVSCTMSRTSVHSSSGSVYQIYSLKSISHFHCIVIRDLI